MTSQYDILIIGGGLVGASLARAVSGKGWKIGVVEAWPLDSRSQPSYDDRVLALSWGTRLILQGIGVWQSIAQDAQPILDIHISDRGHFGFTRLHSRDEGVEALGYVITARDLGEVLLRDLGRQEDIELLCPATLYSLLKHEDRIDVKLEVEGGRKALSTRLLVAADGGDSQVRQLLSIPVLEKSYGQAAIIANLTPGQEHHGVAYERFTDSGPLAVLPMTEGRCSLVWTARDAELPELMGLDDASFLARLQDRFGYRLGRLQRVGRRLAYPLRLIQAKEQVSGRVALIGNASHTIHPVAGQGFNLGIRDAAVLADVLFEVLRSGGDPGGPEPLQGYAQWRQQDHKRVVTITDALARLFANPFEPLRIARNLGMVGLDIAPGLKHRVARQFMGLSGRLPRLARGVPLV
jgi:2-octaprenyl-6-methoxyphenol hydroxylase